MAELGQEAQWVQFASTEAIKVTAVHHLGVHHMGATGTAPTSVA